MSNKNVEITEPKLSSKVDFGQYLQQVAKTHNFLVENTYWEGTYYVYIPKNETTYGFLGIGHIFHQMQGSRVVSGDDKIAIIHPFHGTVGHSNPTSRETIVEIYDNQYTEDFADLANGYIDICLDTEAKIRIVPIIKQK